MSQINYRYVLMKSWPIILANAAVPLLGLTDTAIIGRFGGVHDLAALAVATLVFNFVYWAFGFLRMATTAHVASAFGADNHYAIFTYVLRAFSFAIAIALALLLFQFLILSAAMFVIAPPESTLHLIGDYFAIRIWSAPATLLTYVISGVLIGRGDSKQILCLQVFLNISNAILDFLFAGVFGWGVEGIALGTVIAEYATCALGICVLCRRMNWREYWRKVKIADLGTSYSDMLVQNGNIFIRTLLLLLSFVFFTHIGSTFGEVTIASNHILLQFMAFSAFFLDGFAHVLESLSGNALGKRDSTRFIISLKITSVLAGTTALFLALMFYFGGDSVIAFLTDISEVRRAAETALPFLAIYIALAVFAFQLDGLFIGCNAAASMRNAAIISSAGFVFVWYAFFSQMGNIGLWLSFICYVVFRAIALLLYLPGLLRAVGLKPRFVLWPTRKA